MEALFVGGRAHVSWWTADRAHAAADVERRETDKTWQALGAAPIGGDGILRFDDAAVAPGTRYAYRAGIEGAWSDEAWVDVPAVVLAFARPGVVERGALLATFTLPSAGPARLEAFDLAGRCVATRDVSGAGLHTVELAPARTLRSGVYFLRLAQAGARATARAVLLSGRD